MSADLVRRADAAFVDYMRAMTERAGGSVLESDGLMLWAGASPSPYIVNGAIATADAPEPGTTVQKAAAFFGERGHGWGLHVRDHADAGLDGAALRAGMPLAIELELMVCDRRPPQKAIPEAVELRRVAEAAHVAEFASVAAGAFGSEMGDAVASTFARPASILSPDTVAFTAAVDAVPVAGALAHVCGDTACVAWVGTREGHRGRGLGELVTRAVMEEALEMGAGLVTLEASPMGAPVYRRMGFQALSRYRIYAGGGA